MNILFKRLVVTAAVSASLILGCSAAALAGAMPSPWVSGTQLQSADGANFTDLSQEIRLYIDKEWATVDGKSIPMNDAPFLYNYNGVNYTMVPLRFIGEKGLRAEVNWVPETNTIKIDKNGLAVELRMGVVDLAKGLNCPAISKNGATYVPIRYVANQLGCMVEYAGVDQPIIITTAVN